MCDLQDAPLGLVVPALHGGPIQTAVLCDKPTQLPVNLFQFKIPFELDAGFRVRTIRRFFGAKPACRLEMPHVMGLPFVLDDPRRNALRISIVGFVVMKDDRIHVILT